MNDLEEIKTIKTSSEYKLKEKGSIFLGKSYNVSEEREAKAILSEIKKLFYDATHHCYAYKLFNGNFKYSDDGEPSGTAGIRILNAIDHFQVTNCLITVVRYFGGTKLGVGPLGKAYYNSAFQCLKSSEFVNKKPHKELLISCNFSQMSYVHRILSLNDAKIQNSSYDTKANLNCYIETKKIDLAKLELEKTLRGQIQISIKNEIHLL